MPNAAQPEITFEIYKRTLYFYLYHKWRNFNKYFNKRSNKSVTVSAPTNVANIFYIYLTGVKDKDGKDALF
jgi:hypothetical protein